MEDIKKMGGYLSYIYFVHHEKHYIEKENNTMIYPAVETVAYNKIIIPCSRNLDVKKGSHVLSCERHLYNIICIRYDGFSYFFRNEFAEKAFFYVKDVTYINAPQLQTIKMFSNYLVIFNNLFGEHYNSDFEKYSYKCRQAKVNDVNQKYIRYIYFNTFKGLKEFLPLRDNKFIGLNKKKPFEVSNWKQDFTYRGKQKF